MRLRRFIVTTVIAAFGFAGIAAPVALSVTGGTVTAASHVAKPAKPYVYYRG